MRVRGLRTLPMVVPIVLLLAAAAAQDPVPTRPLPAGRAPRPGSTAEPQLSDEQVLAKAKLSANDGEQLIEYLRQRTLSDTDQGRISQIIKRFGADQFDDRVRATEEIEAFGPAAVGPLKTASKDSDPEIAYRARIALKRVETVPHSAVAAAAVRAVVQLKPEGAAAALIGFLPLADDESVARAIRKALVALAVAKDGKADPGLVAALADRSPVRRAAAYVALIEGGPASERIRIKDAYPKVREAIMKDEDVESKFLGLWSLVRTTRDKEYVPELIALVPKLGRGRIWQLEDLLLHLAGTHPKDGRFLRSPESLAKARDAWLAWWKEKGDAIDLVKTEYKPRIHGITDIIELDVRQAGPGRIVSLGPDLKEAWRLSNVQSPTDMQMAPNGNVLVVESNRGQITEHNTKGTLLERHSIGNQPLNLSPLPDGGALVVCRNGVFEYDKTWKLKPGLTYPRNNFDVISGVRLSNGEVFVVVQGQPQAMGNRLDAKLKEIGKPIPLGPIYNMHVPDAIGDDKVLLCEANRVAEYDLKTAKQTWKYDCNAPSSCQRLPNGNTLICLVNVNPNGQVLEVDPSGEVVWEFQGRDGLRAGRAYRR